MTLNGLEYLNKDMVIVPCLMGGTFKMFMWDQLFNFPKLDKHFNQE